MTDMYAKVKHQIQRVGVRVRAFRSTVMNTAAGPAWKELMKAGINNVWILLSTVVNMEGVMLTFATWEEK